ncbi:PIN domain-containing protein [Pseudotabrizicola alkalilacus]|uniref:Ribonuclease VapC n=1 Tax=Pseudotabrizicola alkalilacus TaxID=2305252 RepID=A0A411YWM0_9RHOB|nr:type II toxin-antitoxin system VapC family toxin [Pseudotabrizicola alkalilacus]RGP35281.1 PIN domain-containing protein [Pseudotabrizicola alkalilacus]
MPRTAERRIGLDTNVLVRFLVQDDAGQAKAAQDLIATLSEAEPGFVCREVLVELVWVLERAYALSRADIALALDGLLEARELVIETADRAAIAVDRYRKGGPGFADQMIALAGQGAGCQTTVTFDRKAASLPGMQALGTVSDH